MITKNLVLALLLVGTSTALAQPAPPPQPGPQAPPAPTAPTEDDKRAQAKSLYETGLSHYNLGEFDEAIKAFRAAYAIAQAPGLLFNIAQSFRLKKDYEQATYFYTTYLRLKPDAPNRADVEERLKEMEKLIEEQKKMQAKPPSGTMTPDGSTTTTTTSPDGTTTTTTTAGRSPEDIAADNKSAQSLITAGYATAGAGGALVITGLVFGRLAKNAERDLEALNTSMGTWTQAHQERYNAGKRNNTIAVISFIAGGAAVATGVTLYVMGTLKKSNSSAVAVVPTTQGATVHVGWTF